MRLKLVRFFKNDWDRDFFGNVLFPTNSKDCVLYGWEISEKEDRSKLRIEVPNREGVKELIEFFRWFAREKFNSEYPLKVEKFIEIEVNDKYGITGKSWTIPAVLSILASLCNLEKGSNEKFEKFFSSGALEVKGKVGEIKTENKFEQRKYNLAERLLRGNIRTFVVNPDSLPAGNIRPVDVKSGVKNYEELLNEITKKLFPESNQPEEELKKKLDFFFNPFSRCRDKLRVELKAVIPGEGDRNVHFIPVELDVIKREEREVTGGVEEVVERRDSEFFFNKVKGWAEERERGEFEVPVFGPGGSGKTFLLKWLNNRLLETAGKFIPLFIEARLDDSLVKIKVENTLKVLEGYFESLPPLLLIVDGLDETSKSKEDLQGYIRGSLGGRANIKGWVLSSRSKVLKGVNDILGFQTKAVNWDRVEEFIQTYARVLGLEERAREVYGRYRGIVGGNPLMSDVLRIPFYLVLFTYLSLKGKLEGEVRTRYHLVVKFLDHLLDRNADKFIKKFNVSEQEEPYYKVYYKIVTLGIWGLLGMMMLKQRLYEDKGDFFMVAGEKNFDFIYVIPENFSAFELVYSDSLRAVWRDSYNYDRLWKRVIERRKVGNPFTLSFLLGYDLVKRVTLMRNPELDEYSLEEEVEENFSKYADFSRDSLENSGILSLQKQEGGDNLYLITFGHRIIHESVISAFLALAGAFLKDSEAFEVNSEVRDKEGKHLCDFTAEGEWENGLKIIAMSEDDGIEDHVSPSRYLGVAGIWLRELADWDVDGRGVAKEEVRRRFKEYLENTCTVLDEVEGKGPFDGIFFDLMKLTIFNFIEEDLKALGLE